MKKRPVSNVIPPMPRVEQSDLSPILLLLVILFVISVLLVRLT